MGARRWVWVLVTIACAWLSACSASTPRVKVMIEPAADANDELPCYLLIRAVDEKSFIADPYQTIADLVMSPDASVLQSAVIFPGQPAEFEVMLPEKGQLAAYVLFTHPDGDWKALLPSRPPAQVTLSLRSSRLISGTAP